MSEPWEKGQKPAQLPNPELNPLQNPTLGKNLGRWAQVYFTSPPEKREQAVGDLLRELESESGPRSPRLEETLPAKPIVPYLICPNCQQANELDQRFCGLCGSVLRPSEEPAAPAPVAASVSNDRREEPQTPVASTEDSDLEWLREKSLSRLADTDESSGKWKYFLVAVVLLAGAFGALQWISNRPTPAAESPVAQPAAPAAPTATSSAQAAVSTPPVPLKTPPPAALENAHMESAAEKQALIEPSTAKAETLQAARVVADTPPAAAPSASTPTLAAGSGGEELTLAQGYLEGKHGMRDSTEAAKWLWKAVAKQNTTADVLLADLYLSGDGVPRSCTQARLLLSAAAQKGEPSAAEKLRQLESSGCR